MGNAVFLQDGPFSICLFLGLPSKLLGNVLQSAVSFHQPQALAESTPHGCLSISLKEHSVLGDFGASVSDHIRRLGQASGDRMHTQGDTAEPRGKNALERGEETFCSFSG